MGEVRYKIIYPTRPDIHGDIYSEREICEMAGIYPETVSAIQLATAIFSDCDFERIEEEPDRESKKEVMRI